MSYGSPNIILNCNSLVTTAKCVLPGLSIRYFCTSCCGKLSVFHYLVQSVPNLKTTRDFTPLLFLLLCKKNVLRSSRYTLESNVSGKFRNILENTCFQNYLEKCGSINVKIKWKNVETKKTTVKVSLKLFLSKTKMFT